MILWCRAFPTKVRFECNKNLLSFYLADDFDLDSIEPMRCGDQQQPNPGFYHNAQAGQHRVPQPQNVLAHQQQMHMVMQQQNQQQPDIPLTPQFQLSQEQQLNQPVNHLQGQQQQRVTAALMQQQKQQNAHFQQQQVLNQQQQHLMLSAQQHRKRPVADQFQQSPIVQPHNDEVF